MKINKLHNKKEEKKTLKEKMQEIFKYKRVRYFSIAILLLIFTIALNIAFSSFLFRDTKAVANIKVAGMEYAMKIEGNAGRIVKGNANDDTVVEVEITAANKYASKYELIYKVCTTSSCSAYQAIPSNFEVKYSSDTTAPVVGDVSENGTKKMTIAIINGTGNDIWIELGVNAGYTHNTLSLAKLIINEYLRPNVIVKLPSNPVGTYNTPLGGTSWDPKSGGLKITTGATLDTPTETINLTNDSPSGAVNFATYIKSLNTGQGVYNEPATDWRYEGKSPNNWLWFNGELWRIIGVFDDSTHGKTGQSLVKIIRANAIGNISWHKNNTNSWPASSLYSLLNNDYYNGVKTSNTTNNCYGYGTTTASNCNFDVTGIINTTYRNMIENATWKLGGISSLSTAANVYDAERGTTVYSGRPTTGTGYIGLMYASDYGYSVLSSSCARTTSLDSYNTATCGGGTWLYANGYEWTLTPGTSTNRVWHLYRDGNVTSSLTGASSGHAIRPVLYLKSDVMKISGNGSKSSPYVITR